jgi:DNA-binding transcriptional LysR family regulator
MEMHQIRYFLTVAKTLNFTHAAEICHVAQPSLSQAIKKLEEELGGPLFRRERANTHLTDLGHKVVPLLTRCYESAVAARDLAGAIKKGVQAPLRLALSHSISLELFVPPLTELVRAFPELELKFLRGNASDIVRALKAGDTELAIAGPLGDDWERFDSWPLYEEEFRLVVRRDHPLARSGRVSIGDLAGQRLIARGHCESGAAIAERLAEATVELSSAGHVASDQDMLALIGANLAVGILPQTAHVDDRLEAIALADLSMTRTVTLYTVAGRERAPAATGLLRLLRAYDYSNALGPDERTLARA